jgi:outer membrane protein assembly factor BamA
VELTRSGPGAGSVRDPGRDRVGSGTGREAARPVGARSHVPVRRLRRLAGALVLLVVGLQLAPDEVAGQTQNRPEILSLQFEGNRSFPDRALANSILTRETVCRSFVVQPFCWFGADFAVDPSFLNPRVFAQDFVRIQLFYRQRGFREVQVDTLIHRETPTQVALTFQIQEGEPVRVTSLELRGTGGLPGSPLDQSLPIQRGDPLDMTVLEAARDTLTQRLRDRGFAHADVLRNIFIPTDTPREAEVEFDIYTGPLARFGEIQVEGNEEVSELVVRRMLPFQEGSVYSREAIFQAQRNLFSLEIFRHAAVVEDLDHMPDSIVPLRVQVNEGNARRVRAGGGWNNADCFTTETRWASRNFMGGARRLVLRGRVSNVLTPTLEESICSGAGTGEFARLNWLASAEFTQPWIFSPRNTFTGRAFAERQSVPDVFIREALGLNLTMTRILGRNAPLSLAYRPELGRLSAAEVFFCTSFLVCSPGEIELLERSNRLAPVALSFSYDATDSPVSPRRGHTLAAEVEHASQATASDFDYERLVAEGTVFQSLPGDMVLGARLRGGFLNASPFRGFRSTARESIRIAHPQKRFYAGGANSVRGYAQSQLGPRVMTVGVEELVFPRGPDAEAICAPEAIADLSCDAGALAEGAFESRPTGGSAVMEGNVELRFPVWAPFLRGVAFVDVGQVWPEARDFHLGEVVVTPGIGLRYATPIGPIRVDVAYRPPARQELPVITSSIRPFRPDEDDPGQRLRPNGGDPLDWVLVDALARLDRPVTFEEATGFSLRRLQFQFAIGHAF